MQQSEESRAQLAANSELSIIRRTVKSSKSATQHLYILYMSPVNWQLRYMQKILATPSMPGLPYAGFRERGAL